MGNEQLEIMLKNIRDVKVQLGPASSSFMVAVVSVLEQIEQKVEALLLSSFAERTKGTLKALLQIEEELRLVWQCTDEACLNKHSEDLDIAQHSAPLAYLHAKAEENIRYLQTLKLFIQIRD
jgi:hypothetical protein